MSRKRRVCYTDHAVWNDCDSRGMTYQITQPGYDLAPSDYVSMLLPAAASHPNGNMATSNKLDYGGPANADKIS
jgi:hypothetical protein